MTILVVDDEQDVEMLFKQRFRREIKSRRLDFDFAESGEAALAYLRNQNKKDLELILSDVNMPGMSGLDLLKVIKDRYPHIKVIIVSAYGDENTHRRAMEYGADDYFTKPVDFKNLKNKIGFCGYRANSCDNVR